MTHPLIDRLLKDFGYPEIDLDSHDEFVAQPGMNVLFFAGDPEMSKDTTYVAVVLPELVAVFEEQLKRSIFRIAVFIDSRDVFHWASFLLLTTRSMNTKIMFCLLKLPIMNNETR